MEYFCIQIKKRRKENREKAEAEKNPEKVQSYIEQMESEKNLSRNKKDELNRLKKIMEETKAKASKTGGTKLGFFYYTYLNYYYYYLCAT